MSIYTGAILLTELLMLAMGYHVLYYPGFTKVEKRWYLFTFIAIFFCAGAEFLSIHFDARGAAFSLPLTILTVLQFSISPLLPAFFVVALGMYRQAIAAGTVFCLHALAEIVSAPFGWIFYYDAAGKYIRGEYYLIYEGFYIVSLLFLIVCLALVSRRFKRRDLSTIVMVLFIMASALLPLIVFKVYTDYLGIGMCASLCYIYYNDLIQEDIRQKLIDHQEKLSRMQEHTISGMANLIESRDVESGVHVARTSQYVKMLAEFARQDGVYADALNDRFISALYLMAPMHDIGKITVSDSILKKPGKLTPVEFEQVKRHASEGGNVVYEVLGGITDEEYLAFAADVAASHHERWDGRGYPKGLSGENIPLSARIMAVADVFDALVSERCYKKAMLPEEAFAIIVKDAGTHFDPNLAHVFLRHKELFVKAMNAPIDTIP